MKTAPPITCRLCKQNKALRHSHVIPEFMYLDLYDAKHRALKIDSNPRTIEQYIQKGEAEWLLCDACESHLAKFETYAAPIVKSLQKLQAQKDPNSYVIQNVDYQLFKLFQLSVLWRSSVASISMFQDITLGADEERVRLMILADDPGTPNDYGCLMFIMENTKYLHRIMWSPVVDIIDGHTVYRFQTGRLFWFYFPPGFTAPDIERFFIDISGILRVPRALWSEDAVVQQLAGKVAETRLRRSTNRTIAQKK